MKSQCQCPECVTINNSSTWRKSTWNSLPHMSVNRRWKVTARCDDMYVSWQSDVIAHRSDDWVIGDWDIRLLFPSAVLVWNLMILPDASFLSMITNVCNHQLRRTLQSITFSSIITRKFQNEKTSQDVSMRHFQSWNELSIGGKT